MKFAIISEGITDQVVLEAIMTAFYKELEDIHINILQPVRDATDKSRLGEDDFGGFELVLEYISFPEKLDDALQVNDYIIIQIDGDICWNDSINIDHAKNCEDVISSIKNLLIEKIGYANFDIFKEHIVFAIPIHSTECWLVPLHTKDARKLKERNDCKYILDNIDCIKGKTRKIYSDYIKLAKKYKNKKNINEAMRYNKSLDVFIKSLPLKKQTETQENQQAT